MINIAIDGPAGAGKSTIAKLVAKRMNYIYVDTGAMYRAIALYIIRHNIDVSDDLAVKEACANINIQIKYENQVQQVYLNNENVSIDIRKEEVGNMASKAAANPAVREKLLQLQRDLANANNVIMDGRDIGTFVLPNANVKIYLTASVEARAKRRFDQLVEKGEAPDLEQIKMDIEQRDYQDMNRDIAPLKQAADAVYLDTSNMNIDQVVDCIINEIESV